MSHSSYLRPILAMLALGLFLPLWVAQAQAQDSQSESVAEAARRARAKKKTEKPPKRVITEDDLKPATPETVTSATAVQDRIPGSAQNKTENASSPAAPPSGEPASTAGSDKEKAAKLAAELKKVKEQLEAAQKELGLLERELTLERDNYYKNPDFVHDTAGKTKLDGLSQQIADKQQEVESLKAKLAALPNSQNPPPSPQS